jgi:putative Ca2+/H+ antiporter (TMEM165/GDT1 family)
VGSFVSAAALGAISEIGDESQIVLFVLSFRFRNNRVAVIVGMVAAIISAHVPAGFAGAWYAAGINPIGLTWVAALLFFGLAGMALLSDFNGKIAIARGNGVVLTVLTTLVLAEIGGKSPISAVLSSAMEGSPLPLSGTIAGVIAINLPVAIAGPWVAERLVSKGINLTSIVRSTAALFALLGVFAAVGLLR